MRRRYMNLVYFTITIKTEPYATVIVGQESKTSDSQGQSIFLLKKGSYSYVIQKQGYKSKIGTLTVSNNQSFTFSLSKESKTVLLMHFNQSIKDEMGHKSAAKGTIEYASGKFGDCLSLRGSGAVHLDDAGFGDIINNSQWTIEFWCYPLSTNLVNTYMINSWYSGRYQFNISGGNGNYRANPYMEIRINGSGTGCGGQCTQAMSSNKWNHVAFVRNGDLLGFVNGIGGSLMGYSPIQSAVKDTKLDIGYKADTSEYKSGFRIDELRISNVARYSSNFTPSQNPFVAD